MRKGRWPGGGRRFVPLAPAAAAIDAAVRAYDQLATTCEACHALFRARPGAR